MEVLILFVVLLFRLLLGFVVLVLSVYLLTGLGLFIYTYIIAPIMYSGGSK